MAVCDPRHLIGVHAERVTDIPSTDYPGHYHDADQDYSWNLSAFKKKLHVDVQRLSNRSIEFDLVGVDASIANALRRILIAEVPTVCIENVYVHNNTSIVQDEVLAHRLGLIPLNVNPSTMLMKDSIKDEGTDRDTLVFKLSLACTRKPRGAAPSQPPPSEPSALPDPSALYDNHELLSSHLVWVPQGEQAEVFAHCPPAPTNPNIVLAKLRPQQEVEIECHAVKGVGKDHAKYSPVATASYRLLPTITLNPDNPIPSHLADKFAACWPKGIVHVHPVTKDMFINEHELRRDPVTREVLRHKEFEGRVVLGRVRDFFLFKIESESAYAPQDLLPEAIKVMREKIINLRKAAETLLDRDLDVQMADPPS